MQTLALEIITPLNECTGRLSRVSTWHKHNRRGMQKSKRKVQGVPQSQTAALPRPQEEEETDKSKLAQTEKTYQKHKISSLFPKRGNRNTKRTEKHKNKMTHGKTYNKSPCRINHKATKSKTNTGTTALERSVEQTTGGLKSPPSRQETPRTTIQFHLQIYR